MQRSQTLASVCETADVRDRSLRRSVAMEQRWPKIYREIITASNSTLRQGFFWISAVAI